MVIQVVEKRDIKVVGMPWNGNYWQAGMIPLLFHEMSCRLEKVPYQTGDKILIAPFHGRETELTYYFTKPVEKIDDIPEGMVGFTIPEKNYVYTTHYGSPEQVADTYQQVYNWMKEYGYEQDYQALTVEVYKQEQMNIISTRSLELDIYIPVKTYKDDLK